MSLTRQIEAARVAREREGERIDAQIEALQARRLTLATEGKDDMRIATYLRAQEVAKQALSEWQMSEVQGIVRTIIANTESTPVFRRLAQHAIDAHCAARAAGERSVYDRADLEKYIEADRLDPMSEIRILTRRLLPSEALTVLLSLLPPENE